MSSITLTWDSDGSIESFSVYRAEQTIDTSNLPAPIATGVTDKTYVDSNIIEDKTYFYRVASNKGSQQKISDEIKIVSSVERQYTTSLLHFDLDFTDQKGVTWVNNGVTIDKTIKKFGDASAYFDGNSRLTTADKIAQIGLEDFTIEYFCYPTRFYVGSDMSIFGWGDGPGKGVSLYISNSGIPVVWDGQNYMTSSISLSLNSWHHVALCRKDGVLMYFVNGTKVVLMSGHTVRLNPNSEIRVGGNYDNDGGKYYYGYLDELRVTVNMCRYTENFTVPTSAFK